jgi:PAS domain S-box-containing protein
VFAIPFKTNQATDRALKPIPVVMRPYVLALSELLAVVALAYLLLHWVGGKSAAFAGLLLILIMLRAAWIGYGPGLLVCLLTMYPVQGFLVPNRPHPVDPIRLGLLIVILLLVSRLSATKRRTEASLRSAAQSLEARVAERTLELSRNQERLREQAELLDLARDAILMKDDEGLIRFWNRGATQMYGWTAEEAVGQAAHTLLKTKPAEPLPDIEAKLRATGSWQGELTQTTRDGTSLVVMSRWALRRSGDGQSSGTLEINTDVTEPRRIEAQLRHAQKIESVGQLAGGVAHDFNNLLTVINGYSEMILDDAPAASPLRDAVSEIRDAGERAASLTQQLLAFSRKQMVQPTVLNLNLAVMDIHKMLRRLIGEHIEIVTRLAPQLSNVAADAGQIQQIILNLAVNARDAMPLGGTLLLETADVEFDDSYASLHPEVHKGSYVMLAVTDTGIGISPEVREKMFEPFFTTKAAGVGTGLGLSTVYGMVKQSNGWIWVYSEPGRGATFKIYLPQSNSPLDHAPAVAKSNLRGTETILVVEDQVDVRSVAVAGLKRYGYTVVSAANADEALGMVNEFGANIQLVVTDIVMPGMSGYDLAQALLRSQPDLRVIFTSGYTEGAIASQNVLNAQASYIQKPYTPEVLAEKVRDVLGPKDAKATVLVVEDDESVRRFLRSVLTGANLAVVEVSNGRQALERVANGHFDLVITDLVMPELEGVETIRRLTEQYPKLKILAISGSFGGAMLEAATKIGAHGALRKPIRRDDLLAAVREVLQSPPAPRVLS